MEKYKIIATLEQLKSIGLNEDELGRTGEFIKDYGDGWINLEVDHENEHLGHSLDFPKEYIERLTI